MLNNLAAIYEAQGRSDELETHAKRALAIVTKTLGPNNPDTAKVIRKLGVAYDAQGRYADADAQFKRGSRSTPKRSARTTASLPPCC